MFHHALIAVGQRGIRAQTALAYDLCDPNSPVTRAPAEATGPGGKGLPELAAASHADLLVAGSPDGESARTRFNGWLGRVLTEASLAVAVAPTGYRSVEPAPIHEVGVVVDESAGSQRAMSLAWHIADELGADLVTLLAGVSAPLLLITEHTLAPVGMELADPRLTAVALQFA